MRLVLCFLFLGLAVPCSAKERQVTEGRYLWNYPPKGEKAEVFTLDSGSLTSGEGVPVWSGDGKGPNQIKVVFDFGRDVALDRITLRARKSTETHRTDFVFIEGRAADDSLYRTLHPIGKNTSAEWESLDASLGGAKVRYVRLVFGRRHNWLFTGVSHVRFYSSQPLPAGGAGDSTSDLKAELDKETLLVDRYGQFLDDTWPGKITSDADFKRDREQEARALKSAVPTMGELDQYGGFKNKLKLRASGFFRLEKVKDVWWLVTPEGNPYFMNGINAITPHEWGYSTGLRTKSGELSQSFQELPDRKLFPSAYFTTAKGERVSFLLANLQRKYGADFDREWNTVMQKRLSDWGFNANAKWHRSKELGLPYISVLWPVKPATKRIRWAANPFEPEFPVWVEAGIKEFLIENKDDPMLIGHTFESEVGWTREIVSDILKQTGAQPAKQAFVDFIYERVGGDKAKAEALLGAHANREDVLAREIKSNPELAAHVPAFIGFASKKYYSIASEIIRRHDPNHLFLGSSLTPGWQSSREWELGAVGYVDGLSFDLYTANPEWIKRYVEPDLPILLLEYGFVSVDRGMGFFPVNVPTQRERGLAYRKFIEPLAATPQFVGAGWFLVYDQAVTGREAAGTGERYNFGFLNQQDQPYVDMLEEVKKTTSRFYELHSGAVAPFKP